MHKQNADVLMEAVHMWHTHLPEVPNQSEILLLNKIEIHQIEIGLSFMFLKK